MGKALDEIGTSGALRYGLGQLQYLLLRFILLPPQLRAPLLRLFGASIGSGSIIHPPSFTNLYRTGFKGLAIGDDCFIADECFFDLAEPVEIGDQVSVGERTTFVTHLNVGYRDRPVGADTDRLRLLHRRRRHHPARCHARRALLRGGRRGGQPERAGRWPGRGRAGEGSDSVAKVELAAVEAAQMLVVPCDIGRQPELRIQLQTVDRRIRVSRHRPASPPGIHYEARPPLLQVAHQLVGEVAVERRFARGSLVIVDDVLRDGEVRGGLQPRQRVDLRQPAPDAAAPARSRAAEATPVWS